MRRAAVVFLVLWLAVFLPSYHPVHAAYRQTFSCSAVLASIAPVDGAGQIAPVCEVTP